MDEAFTLQLKKNIELLVAEGRFNEAYSECTRILDKYPGNRIFIEFKKNLSRRLLEQNKEKVEEGIFDAKKMFKEGQTLSALRKIQLLFQMAPNDFTLRKLFNEFQEKYKSEQGKVEQDLIGKKTKRFKELLETDQVPLLLQEINIMESEYREDKKTQIFLKEIKEEVIKKEIKNKKDLLNSTKFEEIYSFLNNLKNIDKKSSIILDIEKNIKRKQIGETIENIEDFVYTGEKDLDTLLKLGKYDQAVSIATELLEVHPENANIRKILKKAKRKSFSANRVEAVANVIKTLPTLKEEYKNNKDDFVKLWL